MPHGALLGQAPSDHADIVSNMLVDQGVSPSDGYESSDTESEWDFIHSHDHGNSDIFSSSLTTLSNSLSPSFTS